LTGIGVGLGHEAAISERGDEQRRAAPRTVRPSARRPRLARGPSGAGHERREVAVGRPRDGHHGRQRQGDVAERVQGAQVDAERGQRVAIERDGRRRQGHGGDGLEEVVADRHGGARASDGSARRRARRQAPRRARAPCGDGEEGRKRAHGLRFEDSDVVGPVDGVAGRQRG
jgi:hypothetical protein